jgi:hypothetical protein
LSSAKAKFLGELVHVKNKKTHSQFHWLINTDEWERFCCGMTQPFESVDIVIQRRYLY